MAPRSSQQGQLADRQPVVLATQLDNVADEVADEVLVAQASNGAMSSRHAAFEVLVRRHEGVVRNLLRALLASSRSSTSAEPEDLAQETFLIAWNKLGSLREPARFRAWLKQTAYRQFLHRYRRQKLEWGSPSEDVGSVEGLHGLDHDIVAMLSHCNPLEQQLMILCYGFEFTYAQIAAAQDMSIGTVKSHVHRAKQKMRAHIDADDGSIDEADRLRNSDRQLSDEVDHE